MALFSKFYISLTSVELFSKFYISLTSVALFSNFHTHSQFGHLPLASDGRDVTNSPKGTSHKSNTTVQADTLIDARDDREHCHFCKVVNYIDSGTHSATTREI